MKIQGLDFPDSCPEDCLYKMDIIHYGQSALCRYCPVFCCKLMPAEPETGNKPWRLIEPDDIREDWLKEWHEFFQTGKRPNLEI